MSLLSHSNKTLLEAHTGVAENLRFRYREGAPRTGPIGMSDDEAKRREAEAARLLAADNPPTMDIGELKMSEQTQKQREAEAAALLKKHNLGSDLRKRQPVADISVLRKRLQQGRGTETAAPTPPPLPAGVEKLQLKPTPVEPLPPKQQVEPAKPLPKRAGMPEAPKPYGYVSDAHGKKVLEGLGYAQFGEVPTGRATDFPANAEEESQYNQAVHPINQLPESFAQRPRTRYAATERGKTVASRRARRRLGAEYPQPQTPQRNPEFKTRTHFSEKDLARMDQFSPSQTPEAKRNSFIKQGILAEDWMDGPDKTNPAENGLEREWFESAGRDYSPSDADYADGRQLQAKQPQRPTPVAKKKGFLSRFKSFFGR